MCDLIFIRIEAPHFVAGLDLENKRAAPIISYMLKWNAARIFAYCSKKGWKAEPIRELTQTIWLKMRLKPILFVMGLAMVRP